MTDLGLNELSKANLSLSEQAFVIDLAIKTIEADERIEYTEIKCCFLFGCKKKQLAEISAGEI